MKKIPMIVIGIILLLSGCSTTNPALKDVWLNQLLTESYESSIKISVDLNTTGKDIPADQKIWFDLLEKGLIIEEKVKSPTEKYFKITAVDDTPLRKAGYWQAEETAAIEVVYKDSNVYVKAVNDDFYIKLNADDTTPISKGQNLSFNEEMFNKEFIENELKAYIEQYDYKISGLVDNGWKSVETPEGNKQVRDLELSVSINSLLDFLAYTAGNLAEYEHLNELVTAFYQPILGEEITQEDVSTIIFGMKSYLFGLKGFLEGMDEEAFEEYFNVDLIVDGKINVGLTADGNVAYSKNELTIGATPLTTSDSENNSNTFTNENPLLQTYANQLNMEHTGLVKIFLETKTWNVNGEVEIPKVDENVKDLNEFITNRSKLNELENSSILRKYIESSYPREGRLVIGHSSAQIGKNYRYLDVPPYVKKGHTMVPIHIISDMTYNKAKWNAEEKSVTFQKDNETIKLWIGQKTAIKLENGVETKIQLPIAAEVQNGRSFVPLRFISENLDGTVKYDKTTKSIQIKF